MKVDAGLRLFPAGSAGTASEAEEDGYAGVWSSETAHDPFLPLLEAAHATTAIELGTAIAVAFARSPMTTAVVANDLQLYSKGRMLLGLGSQVKAHVERRYSMAFSHPAARMTEYVHSLRAIWAAWNERSRLDFEGDFYHLSLMTPFFDPGPNPYGPPRIFLAAVGALMTEVAGEVADGLLVHGFTTERYLREVTLPALERGLGRSGRSRSAVEISYPGFVVTGEDERAVEAARSLVRSQIAFYGSTPSYRPVLELHGWGDLATELHRLSRQGAWPQMTSLVSDEMVATFAVVAEPADLPSALVSRFSGIVDRFSLDAQGCLSRGAQAEIVRSLSRRAAPRRSEMSG